MNRGGPTSHSQKRILLLIESSRAYGRGCISGVADYVSLRPAWRAIHFERSMRDQLPETLGTLRPDGVIARVETEFNRRVVESLNVPTVDLRGRFSVGAWTTIETDHAAVAKFAFEHLQHCGYPHLAYCGYTGVDWSDRRERAFRACLTQRNAACYVFSTDADVRQDESAPDRELRGENEQQAISDWLDTLPKPIGIFAANDYRGRQVIHAAKQARLLVPNSVGIIGADDDLLLCRLTQPALSSIVLDTRRIGFEAAGILDRMIAGNYRGPNHLVFPPLNVFSRGSTDLSAQTDPDVVKAMTLISDHACEGLKVDELSVRVGVSRSTLERKFRQYMGCSPSDRIEQLRLVRAKQLLSQSMATIEFISHAVGYSHPAHFTRAFRRLTGAAPGEYRRLNPGPPIPTETAEFLPPDRLVEIP